MAALLARRARRLTEQWNGFWFREVSSSNLGLLRIGFGIIVLCWTGTLLRDWNAFFGVRAVVGAPKTDLGHGIWGLLLDGRSSWAWGGAAVLAISALCLTVGFQSRWAALGVFICLISLTRRNAFVFNSGDALLRIIAFYLVLAPVGASLSVDRWRQLRRRGTGGSVSWWTPVAVRAWSLRLMQIQLSAIYFFAVWDKIRTPEWNDGTALAYALQIGDVHRFSAPLLPTGPGVMSTLLTYGSLATEASLAILVWHRPTRVAALCAGVALHLGIDLTMRVGFFSYAIITLYVVFVTPARADAWATLPARMIERWPLRRWTARTRGRRQAVSSAGG